MNALQLYIDFWRDILLTFHFIKIDDWETLNDAEEDESFRLFSAHIQILFVSILSHMFFCTVSSSALHPSHPSPCHGYFICKNWNIASKRKNSAKIKNNVSKNLRREMYAKVVTVIIYHSWMFFQVKNKYISIPYYLLSIASLSDETMIYFVTLPYSLIL
jgi:hypothetical protein